LAGDVRTRLKLNSRGRIRNVKLISDIPNTEILKLVEALSDIEADGGIYAGMLIEAWLEL
jgi:hypothetical protein